MAMFLADAAISLLDDTFVLFMGVHALGGIRGLVGALTVILALVVYFMMGITPAVPKRFFLPLTLFTLMAIILPLPLLIYHRDLSQQASWVISFWQVVLGAAVLWHIQGLTRVHWPLLPEEKLGTRAFSWRNLVGFVAANLFGVMPALVIYIAVCASLAVDHFSGGFLALHPDSLAVRAKRYVRDDGKTIQLIPMMHVGEAEFYNEVSKSFGSNTVVMLEGVTDEKKLLKHQLSYERMASSLGLTEQKQGFEPAQGKSRRADVDVEDFSKNTIEFLDLVTLAHSKGWNREVLRAVSQKSQDPLLLEGLQRDLLTKRNQHLLEEIKSELEDEKDIAVPWGALHMPGIAPQIEGWGFRVADTREYKVLEFRRVYDALRRRHRP
jgi:hypothetical protein